MNPTYSVILPIFSDSAQRPAPKFLCLYIVGLHPEQLQLGVVVGGELEPLQDLVQVLE